MLIFAKNHKHMRFLLKHSLYLKLFLSVFFTLSFLNSNAQISGKITDKLSGQPVIGATIKVMPLGAYQSSGLDGSYSFKNLPSGSYFIQCSYVGYETTEQQIVVNNKELTVNFSLAEQYNELQGWYYFLILIKSRQSTPKPRKKCKQCNKHYRRKD
jgi:hypothetical protein